MLPKPNSCRWVSTIAIALLTTAFYSGCSPEDRVEDLPAISLVDPAIVNSVNAQDIPKISSALADDLKAELLKVIAESGPVRLTSVPPHSAKNQVSDLLAIDDGDGGADLSWTYRNVGDYDQNGEVNLADLTQIGIHYKKNTSSPDWNVAQLADGDENGEVNISDVTPVGQNFRNQVSGYKVFSSVDEADYPGWPDGPNGSGALEAGSVMLASAIGSPGERLRFKINVVFHTPGTCYWVRPYDMGRVLGATSNLERLGGEDATWVHTLGFDSNDALSDLAFDLEDSIYAAGKTQDSSSGDDLLLMKYDIEGNLVWNRVWGGSGTDFATSVSMGSGGEIYVAGNTDSFSDGEQDILLQRWESDGSLTWTKTWGNAGQEYANTVAYMQNSVYVSGYISVIGTSNTDVLLLKFDPSGDLDWARTMGGVGGVEWANDMQAHWSFSINETTIHLTGLAESYSIDPSILYARINEDGDAQAVSVWSGGHTEGFGISVQGALADEVYICGYDGINVTTLLLEYSAAPTATRVSWSHPDQAKVHELLRVDSSLVLCGSYGFEGLLLLNLSLDGALQGIETWLPVEDWPHLNAVCSIPGLGVAGCGYASAADGGSWGTTTGSLSNISGTWKTVDDTTEEVAGVISSLSVAPLEPTGAIIDAGGGSTDALIFLRLLP